MSLMWNEVALLVAAGAFAVLTVYLIGFVKRSHRTMERVDEAVVAAKAALENTSREIDRVLTRLPEVEAEVQTTLRDVRERLAFMGAQIGPLAEDLRAAARSCQDLARTIEKRIDQDLPPILEDVRGITDQAEKLTAQVNEKIRDTQDFFEAARETGETVRLASGLLREGLTGVAVQAASMTVGIKTSLEVLSKNIMSKGGGRQ